MSERKRGILKYAIFADPFKKSNVKMALEFVVLWIHKRDFPRHYLTNMLYRKNVGNIRNYISAKENNLIHLWSKKLGGNDHIFSKDKVKFEHLLKKHHIRTPKIYFYNRGNILYYDDKEVPIKDYQDIVGVIETIFQKENISSLFCKPVQGGRGKDAFKIDRKNYKPRIRDKFDLITFSGYVFQEVIQQHSHLHEINPFNLSTLRIVTYKNKRNEVEVLSGFIRFGRKGSVVDNASAGGIAVGCDRKTGVLRKEGLQLIENGGGIFTEHPDTLQKFEGFQIPRYEEAVSVVKKTALFFDFPILGWDVCITNDFPIIVEVNEGMHLMLSDRIEGGLLKNEKFRELLQEANSEINWGNL